MRPGYERVRRDTRVPPIPDLPLADEASAHRDDVANDVGMAFLVLSAGFGIMLLFAIAVGYYSARSGHQPGAVMHLSMPAGLPVH